MLILMENCEEVVLVILQKEKVIVFENKPLFHISLAPNPSRPKASAPDG